jgi:hypothetical protein
MGVESGQIQALGGTNLSRFGAIFRLALVIRNELFDSRRDKFVPLSGFSDRISGSGAACYLYYLPRRVKNRPAAGVGIGCKILKGLAFKIFYVAVTGMKRAMLLGGLADAVLPIGHG